MINPTRFLPCVAAIAPLLFAVPAAGQSGVERQVVILAPSADDARVELTRAALEFWNRTLTEVGVDIRLREKSVVVAVPGVRAIETFARFVAQRGGRIPKGASGPQPPPELRAVEIVVPAVAESRSPIDDPAFWPPAIPDVADGLALIPATDEPDVSTEIGRDLEGGGEEAQVPPGVADAGIVDMAGAFHALQVAVLGPDHAEVG